jgi:hypothetical protein
MSNARGAGAAQAVFEAAGVAPQEATIGVWLRELWGHQDFEGEGPSDALMNAAGVYSDAEKATATAAAAGFPGAIGFMKIDKLEPFWQLLDESPPAIRAKEQSRLSLEGIRRVAAAKAATAGLVPPDHDQGCSQRAS